MEVKQNDEYLSFSFHFRVVSNMSIEKSFDSGEMQQLMRTPLFYSPVKLEANLQKVDKVGLFSFFCRIKKRKTQR